MAAAVRELRHQRCGNRNRSAASISRPSRAAVHAGGAGHAVVPQQAADSHGDAHGPAPRSDRTEKDQPGKQPGFRADQDARIAASRRGAGLRTVPEPGENTSDAAHPVRAALGPPCARAQSLAARPR